MSGMGRFVALVAFVTAVALLGGGSSAAEDVSLVQARLAWTSRAIEPAQPAPLELVETLPDGVTGPGELGDGRFARMAVPGGAVWVAVDLAPGSSRFWVDCNLNGDLRDDGNRRWVLAGDGHVGRATLLLDAPWAPAGVQIELRRPDPDRRGEVSGVVTGQLSGTAALGTRSVRVALPLGGDALYVDVDGDGIVSPRSAPHERLAVGQPFRVGADGFVVRSIDREAGWVVFARASEAPEPPARRWVPLPRPVVGVVPRPPRESLATLVARIEQAEPAEGNRPELTRDEIRALFEKIGRVGSEEAFDRLESVATKSRVHWGHIEAIRAMGNPAYSEAHAERIAAIAALFPHGDHTRSAVLEALERMQSPLVVPTARARLGGQPGWGLGLAAGYLALHGDELARAEADAVWDRLSWGDQPDWSSRQVFYDKLRLRPEGPPLERALERATGKHASPQAIRDLLVLGHPDAVDLAVAATRTFPTDRRTRAYDGKRIWPAPYVNGFRDLIAVLRTSEDPAARRALLELTPMVPIPLADFHRDALAASHSATTLDLLVRGLKHKQPAMRIAAARALGDLADPKTAKTLRAQIRREKDATVQEAVIEALGATGDPAMAGPLLKLARGALPARQAAFRIAVALGWSEPKVQKEAMALLAADGLAERLMALDACPPLANVPELRAGVLEALQRGLAASDWRVRMAAAEGLRRCGAREGLPALEQALETERTARVQLALLIAVHGLAQDATGRPRVHLPEETSAWLRRLWSDEQDASVFAILDALAARGDRGSVELALAISRASPHWRDHGFEALARTGFATEAAREALGAVLEDGTEDACLRAIDQVVKTGDPEASALLLPGLSHFSLEVRRSVVLALGKLRAPGSVRPLIDQLGRESDAKLASDIGLCLFRLTGVNLYEDAALWNQWWEDFGATFEMPAAVPPDPHRPSDTTDGSFYGIPLETRSTVFVIDTSRSMIEQAGVRIVRGRTVAISRATVARMELHGALEGLSSQSKVNLVFFNSQVGAAWNELRPLTPANRKELLRFRGPRGNQTNLFDALALALKMEGVETVLLVSDGEPNTGLVVGSRKIRGTIRSINRRAGAQIHCVSVGRHSDLLAGLAEDSGGTYVVR